MSSIRKVLLILVMVVSLCACAFSLKVELAYAEGDNQGTEDSGNDAGGDDASLNEGNDDASLKAGDDEEGSAGDTDEATNDQTSKDEATNDRTSKDETVKQQSTESAPKLNGWDKGKQSYYVDGVAQTGFVDIDGVTYYFDKKGVLVKNSFEELFADAQGVYHYVNKKGIVDYNYTGLAQSKTNQYYVENGVINREYTGLVRSKTSRDQYYHVANGKVEKNYTGLSKSVTNWYYVENGVYDKNNATYNGPAQSYKTKAWYHVENSKMQKKKSGEATTQYKAYEYTYTYTNGRLSNSVIVYTDRIYYTDKAGRIKTETGIVETYDGAHYYVKPETSKVNKNAGFFEMDGNKYYISAGGKMMQEEQFDVDDRHYGAEKDCTVCEYTNSSLISGTVISPNKSSRKGQSVKKITIHHMAGVMSGKSCTTMFANPSRKASCNYAIGYDGEIWLGVDEWDRSWCSSSYENDSQAITLEVSNSSTGGDWPVSDKVLNQVINLCVDICQRNGIERLNFTGDKEGNLTMHKYFSATLCPGPYLESKYQYIADTVNERLEKERAK